MNKHTAINDSLPVCWWLWQLIIHNWHVIRHNVIWFLKIHFACELFANLVQCLSWPVSKPVQDTSEIRSICEDFPKSSVLMVPVKYVGICSNYLLKSAGEVAALSFRPSEDGFIVNTTWRLRMTWLVNHLYSSSWESSIKPSFCAPSLHWVMRVAYSSPSKRPGT